MGHYRTYADKNNVIIKNSEVNTGRNPIIEMYYGDGFTRALIYFDFSELLKQVEADQININDNGTKHVLRLFNTNSFDISKYLNSENNIEYMGKNRAYSFDLEVHALTEYWDEGRGYDHVFYDYVNNEEDYNYITGPSNWYDRRTSTAWSTEGAISTGSTALGTVSFDFGKEHLELDITEHVNNLLSSGATGTTHGFVIKWPDVLEENNDGILNYVGFFSRHTHTWFTPHIETIYDDYISDDRTRFYLNKTNRLYFYSFINGEPTNLDVIPTCEVDGTELTVKKQMKGVYYTEVRLDSTSGHTDYTQYQDTWGNLVYNGNALDDVIMDFTTMPYQNFYKLGQSVVEPQEFGIGLSGIRRSERVNQGNKYLIPLSIRTPYTVDDSAFIGEVYYRLYIRQGAGEIDVIPWTKFSYAYDLHHFNLNTTWLIPQEYYIDVKVVNGGSSIVHKEQLDFTVVNSSSI